MSVKASKKKTKQKPPAKLPDRTHTPASTSKLKYQIGIFIAIVSFALYAQSIWFDYAYDDIAVTHGNKIIKEGVKSIPQLMNSDYWYGFTGKKQGVIYRPASLIMFAVEWELAPNNPMIGHLVNVLLFSLTCVLIFSLLCRLFQNNLVVPLLCTLLYAAHPIHTEVVNNIKSRDEILCFLFCIVALTFYLSYYSTKKISSLIAGTLFFFLALLSKETAISFLVMIPVTLFVFRETNGRRLLYSGLTLVLGAAIYLALRQTINIQRPLTEGLGPTDNFLILANGYGERLATASFILLKYLGLLLFPHPLSCDYSYPQIGLRSFSDPLAILSLLLFAAATVFSVVTIWKKNLFAYGILFFLVTIFPVSNIPFLFGSSMAERFLYMPSFGFCLLLTLLFMKIMKVKGKQPAVSTAAFFKPYKLPLSIAFVIAAVYSIKSFSRSQDWKNNLALFGAAAETSSNSAKAHYGYGSALFASAQANEGSPAEIAKKFEDSKLEYERSVALFPQYWSGYLGLGYYYKNKSDFKNSLINFEKAKSYTGNPTAVLYRELGYAYLKTGDFEKSISMLDTAVLMGADEATVLNFKGTALFGLQKYNEALPVYIKALELNPGGVDIIKNIGKCYFYLKNYSKAVEYFKRSVDMQPNVSENYKFLGLTYQVMGDTAKANPLLRQSDEMEKKK